MRYFYHPESDSYWAEEDELVADAHASGDTGDGMAVEVEREAYLTDLALDALRSAEANGGVVPIDSRDAAAEMIEQGVFGPSEDCVDDYGPLDEYVDAVRFARRRSGE